MDDKYLYLLFAIVVLMIGLTYMTLKSAISLNNAEILDTCKEAAEQSGSDAGTRSGTTAGTSAGTLAGTIAMNTLTSQQISNTATAVAQNVGASAGTNAANSAMSNYALNSSVQSSVSSAITSYDISQDAKTITNNQGTSISLRGGQILCYGTYPMSFNVTGSGAGSSSFTIVFPSTYSVAPNCDIRHDEDLQSSRPLSYNITNVTKTQMQVQVNYGAAQSQIDAQSNTAYNTNLFWQALGPK
jgi:hypothetical protein